MNNLYKSYIKQYHELYEKYLNEFSDKSSKESFEEYYINEINNVMLHINSGSVNVIYGKDCKKYLNN